ARRDPPGPPLHRAADAARLRLAGAALRERLHRSAPAADGPAPAVEGLLRRPPVPAPGAHRPRRSEALRDAARRQRLELVRERRARPAVVERRVAYSRARARLRLRGRQTGEGGPPVMAGVKRLALLAGIVVVLAGCGGSS